VLRVVPRGRGLRWLLLSVLVGVVAAALVFTVYVPSGREQTGATAEPAPVGSSTPTSPQGSTQGDAGPSSSTGKAAAPGSAARRILGTPPSRGAWFSGVWPGGGTISGKRADAFGRWRGTAVDAGTTYPATGTWKSIQESNWHITTYSGFKGVLVYGLPMLPDKGAGSLKSVAAGKHDAVYRKVARDLVAQGRGKSVVRIGWEANGGWFRWSATARTAKDYVAAYRHIAKVLRATAPHLVLDFDVACGNPLQGQSSRLDSLRKLYPGNDVVDIVGCDTYDWFQTTTKDPRSWARTKRPLNAVGIQDVADFARAHGKGFSVPEWGLASKAAGGAGDNPYFITKMRGFFRDNRDVLVFESYFNEPSTTIANSLFSPAQRPRSAAVYKRLW
jgi:hypothetical protein